MKKIFIRGLITSLSLVSLAACQDYDGGFNSSEIKKAEYAKDFEKTFGKVDPNQDWSMAGRFTANVNLDSRVEGILSIYTKAPGLNGCYLLAKAEVKEGRARVEFDAVKGSNLLYACIQKNGRNIVAGYYDVVNNAIILSNAQTRANNSASEDNVGYDVYVCQDGSGNNPWRMTSEAIQRFLNEGVHSYNDLIYVVNEFYSTPYVNSTGTEPYQRNSIPTENVYKLKNQHKEHGAEYTMEQLWTIFGKPVSGKGEGGVFNEKEDHIEKYVKTGILERDASMVVAENGEVTVELIWRGTDFNDVFGYFFYPTDGSDLTAEYLWSTNKYILFGGDNTINQSSDLTQVSHWQDANGGHFEDWTNLSGMTAATITNPKSKIRGTKMNLVNFDASGNPSYEFTKGTKIGFFLYNPRNDNNQMYFSDTKLNYQLNYQTYGSEDNDEARPFAVTFDYKGTTLLGFADGCGDYDINDVVFGVLNVEPANEIPDNTPDPEAITWMVACEDLGGTFDYDFNDLVFGLRMTPNLDVTKSTLSLIPYAAGGTLDAHVLYSGNDMGEIHKLVGGSSASTSTPLNVGQNQTSVTPGAAVTLASDVLSTTSINDLAQNIKIQVQNDEAVKYFISKSDYGKDKTAPQMILFQAGWDWPSEGVDIRNLYPNFGNWVAESAYADWYMTKDNSYASVTSPLAKPTTPAGGDGGNQGGGDQGNDGPEGDPVTGGASVTINGQSTNTGYTLENGIYTFNKSYFTNASKITVYLATNSQNNMDACVYQDNYYVDGGINYNAKGIKEATIVIDIETVLSDIKTTGLSITDWTIQFPGDSKGGVDTIVISVE